MIEQIRRVQVVEVSRTTAQELSGVISEKVKEESEKVGLKLNIWKTKIMASGPITS